MKVWTATLLLSIRAGFAFQTADDAYLALKEKDYDRAAAAFRAAMAQNPSRLEWRKEYAYTLLKMGETAEARDEFAEIVRQSPKDWQAVLELGYLNHETKRTREARALFDLARHQGDSTSQAAARTAFQNIDQPLGAAIERWSRALDHDPNDFSAHLELARAAEGRGDGTLAARYYQRAWELKPAEQVLLVDLGRAQHLAGDEPAAIAAWLAASRGPRTRAAESARELLPKRYPYASEFQQAIKLDPNSLLLRRELGFLWIAVNQPKQAEAEFAKLLEIEPADSLSLAQLRLLRLARGEPAGAMTLPETTKPAAARNVREMAEKSYAAGYLNDAVRYFQSALEEDPADAASHLKLGYTYNMLRRDDEAIRHFEIARRSSSDEIRRSAAEAYRNVRPAAVRVKFSSWIYPMFSSRWHSAFGYGQAKAEFRFGKLPLHPYISLRFVGDSRGVGTALAPQYLSESAFIGAVGLATRPWKGLMAWAEAGSALSYRKRSDVGRMIPDYRGGLSFGRAFGPGRANAARGWFLEGHADAVALSRFQWDALLYAQLRIGYGLPRLGPLSAQLTWAGNGTADRERQPWANFVETGPGIRFRVKGMPPAMSWTVDVLRGNYTIRQGNPRAPVYHDVRAALWYSVAR
ncbi:MAG: tetratricopeptide repeat protein [Candidatus Solibacter usitatus]|nr:tetratricopeptide repeat protein [Candidatus Solibacter usitatus]